MKKDIEEMRKCLERVFKQTVQSGKKDNIFFLKVKSKSFSKDMFDDFLFTYTKQSKIITNLYIKRSGPGITIIVSY